MQIKPPVSFPPQDRDNYIELFTVQPFNARVTPAMVRPSACSFALHAALAVALVSPHFFEQANARPADHVFVALPPNTTPVNPSSPPAEFSVRMPATFPLPQSAANPVEPAAKPAAVPAETSRRTTLADFRRSHPLPASSPMTSPRSRFEPATRLDPAEFSFPDRAASFTPTTATPQQTASFIARLVEELRGNYSRRDVAVTGLSVLIEFKIVADGRLGNVRILEASGSAEFDSAVLAAAGKTGVREIPAGMIGEIYTVRFRAREAP